MSEEMIDDEFRPNPNGGHSHSSAFACGRGCPKWKSLQREKAAARKAVTLAPGSQAQNSRGEWVPAIPEPYFLAWGRVRCDCGETFRGRRRFREHYALAHVLALD